MVIRKKNERQLKPGFYKIIMMSLGLRSTGVVDYEPIQFFKTFFHHQLPVDTALILLLYATSQGSNMWKAVGVSTQSPTKECIVLL